jgi:tRNA/tmRNA/rRNA uracil-C5-methylase (TrmA/RlmC/RlmD family)
MEGAQAARPRRGDELELRIDRLAYGGAGVARANGYVVFVRDAVPGDRLRARITRSKRSFAEADMVELLEPSPDRVEPHAPHPGAPWQVLPYELQLKEKEAQVRDALERLGGFERPPVQRIVPAEQQLRYRNKVEYSFGADEEHDLVLGFHRRGRFDLIDDVSRDILASERVDELREAVKAWCREEGLSAWDRRGQSGLLRNLVVREGRRTGQLQARVVTSPGAQFRAAELAAAIPAESVLWTRAASVAETTREGVTERIRGRAELEEQLCGLTVRISPDAFFQTNTEMAERLYATAAELAELSGRERVLDLYCGIGTIARGRCHRERPPERRGQRAVLRGRCPPGDATAPRAGGPARSRRAGPAAGRPLEQGGQARARGGGEANRLRVLQPDDAGPERAPVRRRGLRARNGAPGGHVPPDAAYRVRGTARAVLARLRVLVQRNLLVRVDRAKERSVGLERGLDLPLRQRRAALRTRVFDDRLQAVLL